MNPQAIHKENQKLLDEVQASAQGAGLHIRLQHGPADGGSGVTHYALLGPGRGRFTVSSARCFGHADATYKNIGRPSEEMERKAIKQLQEIINQRAAVQVIPADAVSTEG